VEKTNIIGRQIYYGTPNPPCADPFCYSNSSGPRPWRSRSFFFFVSFKLFRKTALTPSRARASVGQSETKAPPSAELRAFYLGTGKLLAPYQLFFGEVNSTMMNKIE
jgi:hypothetical protein